ncbi:uncharacterized protein LOC111047286 [Nilaparvata lugens]|uniref:uncharacterized protein LOC111047286 n=1 Tax=Nilaparvata lugens TaxID=108931 RepID=UPI00193CE414|nr:uncharacterized protein LOC111047286 [Nilaparvata lugens]
MAGQSQFQSQVHFLCCFGFLLGLQRPSEAASSPAKLDTDLSPPKYEFGYEVRDDRGGQQGHLEARDGVYALGKYYVKLPDGSDQKVNYFTDDLGYHPLVEYNSASPSGSSRTQFAMGEKAVAALVKSISDIKTTHDFDSARKLTTNKKQENSGKVNSDLKNSNSAHKPGSSVYIGLASTPAIANDVHVESSTPTPHFSTTPSSQHSSSVSESSNFEENLYAFDEPTLAPLTVSSVSPPQGGSLLMHTINLEGGGDQSRLSSSHRTLADFGMKLQRNPLSTFLNIHSHKFSSTSQPVTSNYVEKSVEDVTQRGSTTVDGENYSQNTKDDIVQTSPTVAAITTLHTNPYSIINVDVSPNGEDSRAHEINSQTTNATSYSTSTTTDKTAQESELRYTISTTPASTTPDDTFIRPIVVPDGPFEMQSFYTGLLKTTEEMKNFIINLNRTLITNEGLSDHESGEQYKLPPPLIQQAHLAVTEEDENSLHTSSNQILAPIQAAVSLSASELSGAEATSNSEEVKALESAELVVEKQTLEKQPVLKTTIDIQKSIPFEIPHQESSVEENEESQPVSNDHNSPSYQQGAYLPIHQSINEEFSKIDKDASSQNVRSQFLQQVYSAYQSLANNPNASPYYSPVDYTSEKVEAPGPVPTQQAPKKLYYVYLQGYNSGMDRYAPSPQYSSSYQNNVHQQGLETNYGGQLTNPITALPPGSFSQSSAHIYRNGEPNLNVATFINHGNSGQSVQYNRLIEAQHTDENENHNGQYTHLEGIHNQMDVVRDESNRAPLKVQYISGSSQNLPLNHLNALSAESFHKYLEQTTKANGESAMNGYNAGHEPQYNGQIPVVSQNPEINGLRINSFLHSRFLGEDKLKLEQVPSIRPALPVVPQVPLTWPHALPLSRVAHLPYLQPYLQMSQLPIPPYKQVIPYPLTHYLPLQNTATQVASHSTLQPTVYNRNDQHENPKKEGPKAPFRPSQKLYHSVYPPEMYYVAEYMRPNARSRGLGKKLCIEYGGFKPPLIPSVQIDEKLEVNIGKRVDKTD